MDDLVGAAVELSTVQGYDYDGTLDRFEFQDGKRFLILLDVRKRNWMDDTDREGGAHEVIHLGGERRFRADYIIEIGPCSYPRD